MNTEQIDQSNHERAKKKKVIGTLGLLSRQNLKNFQNGSYSKKFGNLWCIGYSVAVSNLDANEIKKIRTLNTEPPVYDHASDSVPCVGAHGVLVFIALQAQLSSQLALRVIIKKQKTGIPIVCIVRTLVVLLFDTIQRTPAQKRKKKRSITEKTSRNRRGNKIHLGERFAIGNRSEETRKRKISGGE